MQPSGEITCRWAQQKGCNGCGEESCNARRILAKQFLCQLIAFAIWENSKNCNLPPLHFLTPLATDCNRATHDSPCTYLAAVHCFLVYLDLRLRWFEEIRGSAQSSCVQWRCATFGSHLGVFACHRRRRWHCVARVWARDVWPSCAQSERKNSPRYFRIYCCCNMQCCSKKKLSQTVLWQQKLCCIIHADEIAYESMGGANPKVVQWNMNDSMCI